MLLIGGAPRPPRRVESQIPHPRLSERSRHPSSASRTPCHSLPVTLGLAPSSCEATAAPRPRCPGAPGRPLQSSGPAWGSQPRLHSESAGWGWAWRTLVWLPRAQPGAPCLPSSGPSSRVMKSGSAPVCSGLVGPQAAGPSPRHCPARLPLPVTSLDATVCAVPVPPSPHPPGRLASQPWALGSSSTLNTRTNRGRGQ